MKKILIINANYYNNITDKLVKSSLKILKKQNYQCNLLTVLGVFEIPLAIKKNIKRYDAFLALGCVVKGKTPHFDLICKSTFQTILLLSINYCKPIGNGIITALNMRQAFERCGTIKSNKKNKGLEAAKAVISSLSNVPKKI